MPKHGDTGALEIRASIFWARDGLIIDPSRTVIRVELWGSAVLIDQERCIEDSAVITGPITDSAYEDAYRGLLGDFSDWFKESGCVPPVYWKERLAREVGTAMGKWMARTIN